MGFTFTASLGTWVSPAGYTILININANDFKHSTIDYGNLIIIHNRTTCNLRKPEHSVVLECVISLLEKGYSPSLIEIEKTWPLGHAGSGRLDIFLRDPSGVPYAMIECKQWGRDYTDERNNMLEDGGQLFSYFAQDRSCQALYLYSSRVNETIDILTEFIATAGLTGTNVQELYSSWNTSFRQFGIFHHQAGLYDDAFRGIQKMDLQELDRSNGSGVFNSFAEILRRHVVSDKPNAFNRIFNLFLCKIADEDEKTDDQEVDFQWKYGDTGLALLDRLRYLYSQGLTNYLGVIPEPEYQDRIGEFAFIDVYNQKTFDQNLEILREVVELLQPFRIRYSAKQQYLGDFFEMLLNSGVKQESGQFFTPVPLARAILSALPIGRIIEGKIEARKVDVLPYVIDFACGAGHFLTEAISEIDQIATNVTNGVLTGQAKSRYEAGMISYLWARDYIYGIEKDHRLAKVTKIATFLNGDGDANIMQGDGLGAFESASGYVKRLLNDPSTKSVENFDIVVANPPFSVKNFRKYLHKGAERFSLYQYLTADSSEIECLFLERTSQLLGEGGVAGVIFPLSILSSTHSIYKAARRMLAVEFELCGMLEMREKTFIATPTTTVCLFLKKRDRSTILEASAKLLDSSGDREEIEEILLNAGLSQVIFDAEKMSNEVTNVAELVKKASVSDCLAQALRAIMDAEMPTIVGFTGTSVKQQEQVLGYRFSRSRGSEGCKAIESAGEIETLLYDPLGTDREDRFSVQVRKRFLGELPTIPLTSDRYMKSEDTSEIWDPLNWTLQNPSAFFTQHGNIDSYNRAGDLLDDLPGVTELLDSWIQSNRCSIIKGVTYAKTDETPSPTPFKILTASNLDLSTQKLISAETRFLRTGSLCKPEQKPIIGDIIICTSSGSLRHLGKIVRVTEDSDAYIGGFLAILRCTNQVDTTILEFNLLSKRFRTSIAQAKEQNISNLTEAKLKAISLHVPNDLSQVPRLP
jgi:type I restriction enzyme M protein